MVKTATEVKLYVICGCLDETKWYLCIKTPHIFPVTIDQFPNILTQAQFLDDISFDPNDAHPEIKNHNNLVPLDINEIEQIMPILEKRFPKREK